MKDRNPEIERELTRRLARLRRCADALHAGLAGYDALLHLCFIDDATDRVLELLDEAEHGRRPVEV